MLHYTRIAAPGCICFYANLANPRDFCPKVQAHLGQYNARVPGAARWCNNCASGVRLDLVRQLQPTQRPEQLIVCALGHGEHDRTVVEGGRALHQVAHVWRREGKDLEISTLSQSGLGPFVQSFTVRSKPTFLWPF